MMAQKKQAKFFCENCGAEVAQNARFCKKCGRFFSSVRCPVCGKTGSSNMFANGCPSCGYAGKERPGVAGFQTIEQARSLAEKKGHFFFRRKRFSPASPPPRQNDAGDQSLPAWIYCVSAAVFLGLVLFFVKCVMG